MNVRVQFEIKIEEIVFRGKLQDGAGTLTITFPLVRQEPGSFTQTREAACRAADVVILHPLKLKVIKTTKMYRTVKHDIVHVSEAEAAATALETDWRERNRNKYRGQVERLEASLIAAIRAKNYDRAAYLVNMLKFSEFDDTNAVEQLVEGADRFLEAVKRKNT